MQKKRKTIIYIIIVFVLFIAGFFSGYFIKKNSSDRSAFEYRNTIDELRTIIDTEKKRYEELEDLYGSDQKTIDELTKRLDDITRELGQADNIISGVREGLEKDLNSLRQIIEAIRNIRETIESYESLE